MSSGLFTTDTFLDVLVNLIPIVIMGFFLALYLVVAPWGPLVTRYTVLQVGLLLVPIFALAVLTYEAAKRIEGTA